MQSLSKQRVVVDDNREDHQVQHQFFPKFMLQALTHSHKLLTTQFHFISLSLERGFHGNHAQLMQSLSFVSSIDSEAFMRVIVFTIVFLVMLIWESIAPRRTPSRPKRFRWFTNLAIAALSTAFVRVAMPLSAFALAIYAADNQWGIFNRARVPPWLAIVISVVILDAIIYFQHRLFHRVPVLWRLHRMHHSDVDIDTSTGIRFHPIEIFISMAIKMTAIVILGAAPIAVLIFEILLNATSLFNHGNVFITNRLDRILRWIVVTPEMHRVHHSTDKIERNRNFGFNFPYWDYLFGTYRDQPALGHDRMMIGLNAFRELSDHTLQRLLLQPFKKS